MEEFDKDRVRKALAEKDAQIFGLTRQIHDLARDAHAAREELSELQTEHQRCDAELGNRSTRVEELTNQLHVDTVTFRQALAARDTKIRALLARLKDARAEELSEWTTLDVEQDARIPVGPKVSQKLAELGTKLMHMKFSSFDY